MFISYAKNLEDVVLWRALGEIEGGTYLDVGATDPVRHSATFALYRQGWRERVRATEPSFVDVLGDQRPEDVVVAAAAEPASPVPSPVALGKLRRLSRRALRRLKRAARGMSPAA